MLHYVFIPLFAFVSSLLSDLQLSGQFSQRLFRKLPPRVCVPLKNIVSEEFLRAGSVCVCVNGFVVIKHLSYTTDCNSRCLSMQSADPLPILSVFLKFQICILHCGTHWDNFYVRQCKARDCCDTNNCIGSPP